MRTLVLFYFLFLFSSFCFAQSDFDSDQQKIFSLLYPADTQEQAKEMIESKFLKSPDDSKKIIGYINLSTFYFDISDTKWIQTLQKANILANKTGRKLDKAYVEYGYAIYYYNLGKTELFMQSLNNSLKIFEEFPHENFMLARLYRLKTKYGDNIIEGKSCISIYNYNKALEYALKSKSNTLISIVLNDMGTYYDDKSNVETNNTNLKIKRLDSARTYFSKSYNYAQREHSSDVKEFLMSFYFANMGGNFVARGQYSEGLKFYNKALNLNSGEKGNLYLIYNNIGQCYMEIGDMKQAEEFNKKAYEGIKPVSNKFSMATVRVYNNLSEFYQRIHQPEKALMYEKELNDYTIRTLKLANINNAKALDIFYKAQQKQQKLEEKNNYSKKLSLLYWGIILLSVVAITALIFILRYRQRINRQKNELLRAEKTETETELLLELELEEKKRREAEHKLLVMQQEHIKKQAMLTSLRLEHKNTFISELKKKIKEQNVGFDKTLKEEDLSDQEFSSVQKIFEEIHPQFFKKLNEVALNKLTDQDLKYAAYIYMGMNNHQISNALKADANTVRVAKYRLKQKLGLTKEEDLNFFLQNLLHHKKQ